MCKLDELTLSADHLSVLCDGGVWNELPDRIENVAFVLPKCQSCPKESFLHCLLEPSVVTRKALCEMGEDAKVFENTNPPPQDGTLFKMKLEKENLIFEDGVLKPKPVVVEEPKHEPETEPPKRSFVDKLRSW